MSHHSLPGLKLIEFRDAIKDNFDLAGLEDLLLGLNHRLEEIVIANGVGMGTVAMTVIKAAEKGGWLLTLIKAAYEARKNEVRFQRLHNEFQPLIKELNIDPCEVVLLPDCLTIFDRKVLRAEVCALRQDQRRILIIDGERFSGKTYSRQLIVHLQDKTGAFKLIPCDLSELAKADEDGVVTPQLIAECLANQMGLEIPARGDEKESLWAMRFCDKIVHQLHRQNTNYWIFIDHFNKALLRPASQDLIMTLAMRIQLNLPMLRLILVEYKESDNLKDQLDRPIGQEYIPSIQPSDLTDVFITAYENRKSLKQVDYLTDNITESITKVWSRVDTGRERWLRDLAYAVSEEVRNILR